MSIPSKTRKDQKAHEHSSNPCEKALKPMNIATKTKKQNPRRNHNRKEMLEPRPPALRNTPLSHAHTASPRPLARTHDTNTKRNRNQFPDWGSPASINSPQSPIINKIANKIANLFINNTNNEIANEIANILANNIINKINNNIANILANNITNGIANNIVRISANNTNNEMADNIADILLNNIMNDITNNITNNLNNNLTNEIARHNQSQHVRINDFLASAPEVDKTNPRTLDLMTFWPWLQKSTKPFPRGSI